MIIHKQTKEFQTRSDKPNENWLNDNNYLVINDNSILAEIIIANYPHIDLVIQDNILTNVEVDVDSQEREKQKAKIQAKIVELKDQLAKTDYKAIKFAEGVLEEEDYAYTRTKRQDCRNYINELEEDLRNL